MKNRYIKKPVTIQAYRIFPSLEDFMDNFSDWPDWLKDAHDKEEGEVGRFTINSHGALIHTLEGVLEASGLDYIIRGVRGELYFCRADIFEETYEAVV